MVLSLSDIVGQDHLVAAFRRVLERHELAHCYLFEGPNNVGKVTLARALAAHLLCLAGNGAPCGTCTACQLVAAGTHPDFVTVRPVISAAPSDKPERWLTAPPHLQDSIIPMQLVRGLQHQVALRPAFGKTKVMLVQEADRMSEDSQNCALKTLEEPAPGTVLILTAANARRFLPTILSRSQRMAFRLVSRQAMEAWLAARGESAAESRLLARLAEGRPGRAVRLRSDTPLRQVREQVGDLVRQTVFAEPLEAMRLAECVQALSAELWEAHPPVPTLSSLKGSNETRARRSNVDGMLVWMTSWLRDLLLAALNCNHQQFVNEDHVSWLQEAARARSADWFIQALSLTSRTRRYLQQNANLKLALDAMFTGLLSGATNN